MNLQDQEIKRARELFRGGFSKSKIAEAMSCDKKKVEKLLAAGLRKK